MVRLGNPFTVTKAGDFSDEQIHALWVDLSKQSGFEEILKPRSPMPMLIIGGKGCGKTHLMRYFSFPLQKLRCTNDLLAGLNQEGYLGVYLRCEGLNAEKFSGKGQDDEKWNAVFEYYMELWLARLLLTACKELFAAYDVLHAFDRIVSIEISSLVAGSAKPFEQISEIVSEFARLQQELDHAVNNCALTRTLSVDIRATRGALIFGIPTILRERVPQFASIQIQYLIDELENLSISQQQYVNTLVREKKLGSSFKIGARKYGVKTYKTLSGGEENKEGSEFEKLPLDEVLRENPDYFTFARRLVLRRIREAGYLMEPQTEEENICRINQFFEAPRDSIDGEFVADRFGATERPYISDLRNKMTVGMQSSVAPGITSEKEIEAVVALLQCAESPILEKLNIYLLYRQWNKRKDLLEAAKEIRHQCDLHRQGGKRKGATYADTLGHFRSDFLAQLYRVCDKRMVYCGLDAFITMSSGLPRNLLNILKHVFKWSTFLGEKPFLTAISIEAQSRGVRHGAEWFFADACTKGYEGPSVQTGIRRLAVILREIRFSDKPAECSPCTFSVDITKVSEGTAKLVSLAEQFSLLIKIPKGHKDKNSMEVDEKFQLNPMLAPLWDLPIARRGTLEFSHSEVDALFSGTDAQCNRITKARVARMNAPFFGKKGARMPRPHRITDDPELFKL